VSETEVVDAPATETAPPTPAVDWAPHVPKGYETVFEPYKGKPLGEVLKGYGEASKMIGRKQDEVLKDPVALRTALGVPDAPEKYRETVKRPAVALDGAWDEQAENAFFAAMHQAGAPPQVVKAAMDFYGGFVASQLEAHRREAKAVGEALKTEWGPNYDANLGRANRAIQEFGGDTFVEFLASSGLGRHPLMVKFAANVGNALVEHGAIPNEGPAGMGPEEATAEIQRMRTDKTHPLYTAFMDPNHKEHQKALDHLQSLYAARNRGQTPE
jgi:hypothetical protein